jgi:hypothetical protein
LKEEGMFIDVEDKREIIDLYNNQHKTIREVTKIKRKSVRDIVAVLKERKEEEAERQEDNDNNNKSKDKQLLSTKAY